MRILSVSPYWPPEGGGLERYAREMLRGLAARGHGVRAVAFARRRAPRSFDDGPVDVRLVRPHAVLSNTPLRAGFASLVAGEIRAHRPDVVVGHGPVPFPLEMAARAAARTGTPFVPVVHAASLVGGTLALDWAARLDRRFFFEPALASARRIVAVSPAVRDDLLLRHAERVAVVPPGVDLARFRPGPPPDPSRVLFVGPLDSSYAWKGFHVLYDAALRANVHLTAVGEGDELAAWRRRAIADRARAEFPGRLGEEALVGAYHAAGVVALPSLSAAESFGMVLAEGAACGRPAVASRVGGIPSFVRDGENGFLAEPGDVGQLADALARLARDPELAREMGRRGRRRVEDGHRWDALTERFEGVLEASLDGEGPRGEKRRPDVSPSGPDRAEAR